MDTGYKLPYGHIKVYWWILSLGTEEPRKDQGREYKESGVTKYKVIHFCFLTPGLNIILILILVNYIIKNYFYSEIKKIAFNF